MTVEVLQLLLALGLFGQVADHVRHGAEPLALPMMGVSLLALAANLACLVLIARHRDGGAHMKASYIFSANDVLANLGVILAGGLVAIAGATGVSALAAGDGAAADVAAGVADAAACATRGRNASIMPRSVLIATRFSGSCSTPAPFLPITMPGRAVNTFTRRCLPARSIVILETEAMANFFFK